MDKIQDAAAPLLASYHNGGYQVDIFADGTKVRVETEASLPPAMPEQMDLKLTD